MLLRDHPLMTYKGLRSWPPAWGDLDIRWEKNRVRGEVGTLRQVVLSRINPADRCFLHIDHEETWYMGCVLIDDHAFCTQISELAPGLLQSFYCRHRWLGSHVHALTSDRANCLT